MSVFYVAALARNSEGTIFATVPDLPGVNSAAATRAEALALAIEFANDYMRDLITEGHEVPAARDIDDIPVEAEDQEIGRALIPVERPDHERNWSCAVP
jgi:predicted RNase H-like HicB family nuclease